MQFQARQARTGCGRWRSGVLGAVLMAGLVVAPQHAVAERIDPKLKAELVYHFLRLVQWPEGSFFSPRDPLVVGVLGRDRFVDKLEKLLAGRGFHGRRAIVQRFASLDELMPCHVLFVARSKSRNIPDALTAVQGLNVLTISDARNFVSKGGMIELSIKNGGVSFKLSRKTVEGEGLRISERIYDISSLIGG